MKKLFLTFFLFFFYFSGSVAYSQNLICEHTSFLCPGVDSKEIIYKDGMYYTEFNSIPFTGKVIGKEIGLIKKGKKEGYWVGYDDNGKIKYTVNFKNGDWDVGSYNGHGTYTFSSGDQYVGKFKDGKYNGQGTYTFSSGDKYIGQWKNNIRTGEGTYHYSNGDKYLGQWKNDTKSGQGTLTYLNGDQY